MIKTARFDLRENLIAVKYKWEITELFTNKAISKIIFLVKISLDGFLIFCQLKVTLSNILAWSIIDFWLSLNLQLQLLLVKHTVELLNFSWLGKHSFYIIIRKNMYVWQTRLRLQQLLLTREQVFYQSSS